MAATSTVRMGMAVQLTAASDVQAALDANPVNTTFRLAPGTYRPADQNGYNPKHGQRLIGRGQGVILSGAKVLPASGGWTVSGATWWATAFLPGAYNGSGECRADGVNGLCSHKQNVFRDGTLLTRVASQGAVTTGTFFTDYTNNRVYVGDDPNGHLIEQAWANYVVKSSNHEITVQNVVVEKSAVSPQEGAVACRGHNWTVAYCELRYNHGAGLEVGPSGDPSNYGTHAHHNYIHHNGQIGVVGSGHHHTIELNEVAHNNKSPLPFNHGWEAGGIKTGEPTWYDGVIRGNYVHDNSGPGIWQDVAAGTTDVDDNYVKNNIVGIMYEISYGTRPASAGGGGITTIRNNITVHNIWDDDPGLEGSAGIVNMASLDVEVFDNEVYDERSCILGFQQDRPDSVDARGDHVIKNFSVHDNLMDFNGVDPEWTGKTGMWTDVVGGIGNDVVSAPFNNHWEDNDYRYTDDTVGWFDWAGTDYFKTFTQWKAFSPGHDNAATFTEGSALTPPDPPTLTVGPQP